MHKAVTDLGSDVNDKIPSILRDTVTQFDDALCSEFSNLFPKDLRAFGEMSDTEIQAVFENTPAGTENQKIADRSLGGKTLLLSLTDPSRRHLWVTNLGGKFLYS